MTTKKHTKTARIRSMHAAGYTAEHIAIQLGAKPYDVRRILERTAGAGRPRHTLTLDEQLRWAERIYESCEIVWGKELARQLVGHLSREIAKALLRKSARPGG